MCVLLDRLHSADLKLGCFQLIQSNFKGHSLAGGAAGVTES